MTNVSVSAKEYAIQTKGAAGSTEVFVANQQTAQAELKATTAAANGASTAMKALSIAGNMFVMWAISEAISFAASKINDYVHELDNARDASKDAQSTINQLNQSVSDNDKWISSNLSRYEELADGVDSLGRNVSLTDDEFAEYNSLTNEIADMFPTLVTGYTDTGDAILSCKNNVDLLTKAYEEQKQAAQDSVLQKSNDLWAGFKADTTKSNIFSNGGLSKVSELQALQKMINGQVKDISNGALAQILNNAGVDKVNGNNRAKLVKQIEENKQLLLSYVRTLQSTLDASTSQITPIIDAFLGDNKDFQKFDSQTQNSIKQIADNMGYEFYSQFENPNELVNWIDNTLVPAFQNADTKNLLTKLFSLNKEDMPVSEYVQEINSLIEQIANAIGGEPDKIKVKLGFDFVDTDEELLNKAKKKVDEAFSNNSLNVGSVSLDTSKLVNKDELKKWIDTLSSDDLKLIAQGEIKFDENTTVQSAKEALKAAQNCADENPIEANATISSVDALADIEALSNGLDQLDSIYADILDGEDFDWGSILNNKDFQDIFGSMGETYENFINTVTNNPADISACQAAFDDLTNAYIYQSGVLDELNESNAQAAINMLDSMGVANAEAVVMNYLAAQTEYAAIAKDNAAYSSAVLAEATLQDINNILMEGSVTEDTKNQIIAYYLEKLTASGISLDTAEDCNQLINLIDYLGGATGALSIYYSALQGSMNVSAVNGSNSHGGLSGKDMQYTKQMAQVQAQKEAEKKLNEMLEKTQNSMSKVSFKGGTKSNGVRKSNAKKSSGGSGSGSKSKDNDAEKAQKEAEEAAKKAEEERKKAIEEEEKRLTDALSRIQNAIDELDKEASNKFHNWDERNSALQAEMDTIPQAIAAQQQLVDFYNTTGNDPTKAQEAANAIKDLRRQLEELANQKLENIKQFNEDIISLIDSLKELSQSIIDIKEARGFAYNAGDYQELISKSEEERRQYEKELSELQAQLQYNIDRGYLQEGSETWYEWQKELNGIKKSMNECIKAQVEWNKEIQKIPFTALENFGKLIDKATTRLDNFASQLEERGLALSVADINEQLMAANEKLLIAQGNANEYYNVIRRNFSDEVNGWGKLTEEQLKQVFHYIDTDDSLRLHNYLADLGFDNYTLQEFYEYVEKLGEANNEIIELKTNIIKLNNAVDELNISGAEKYGVLIEKLNSEISSYNDTINARGLSKSLAEIMNEIHGLASTVMIEQNKINNYNRIIAKNLTDDVNGWAKLREDQLKQVFRYIENNDHQGLFDLFNSMQINPATLDEFWELVQDIETASSNIASATTNQIELNKTIKQMDITVFQNLQKVLEKINTEIEGLKNLMKSHGGIAPDAILEKEIQSGMKSVKFSKRKIYAYEDYIRSQFSDAINGWADLAEEDIKRIFKYLDSGDVDGLDEFLNNLGLATSSLTEFWDVVSNIQQEESNIFSDMVNQEGYFNEMLENRITELNKIREKLQKINEEKNKALELEKARYALIQAENNRNVMTWDGNQMVWTSDADQLSNALDNLNNLEFDALIDAIDNAVDAINDLIDNTNLYDNLGNLLSNWKDIIESAQSSVTGIVNEVIKKLSSQGYDFDIPQFATGGVINGVTGDRNLVLVSDKERVLTPYQNEMFEKMIDYATNYAPQFNQIFDAKHQTISNLSNVKPVTTTPIYQFNGDFVMPNVHDGSKVNDLIKDLNSITLKAQQRVNRIN